MIFQVEGVQVARGGRYRPATREELYVQARLLGLAGCSRMTKQELARAVARARSRPAALGAAARICREQMAAVAGRTVGVLVTALGRLRGIDRLALPLAAVLLSAGVGASMPVLIAAGTPEGVAAPKVVTLVPAAQESPDMIRFVDSSQKPTRAARGEARPTGTPNAAVVAVQEGSSSAVDQPAQAQIRSSGGGAPESSGGGAPEPSASAAPQAPAAPEQNVPQPTPEPTPTPTSAPPVEEEPEEQPAEETTTLCHKAGSKNAKTLVVGADAVEEHLAHGDTLGVCP